MESISIVKHQITNLAGFKGEHTVNFEPGVPSVILGINGSGKTTLLNSLFGTIEAALSRIISFSSNNEYSQFNTNQKNELSIFSITLNEIKSESVSSFRVNNSESLYKLGVRVYIQDIKEIMATDPSHLVFNILFEAKILPIFRYFQAEKSIHKEQAFVTSQIFNNVEHRSIGYKNYNGNQISIQEVTNFFINQINIENQLKVEKQDLTYTTPISNYIKETLNLFTETLYNGPVEVSVGASKYSAGQCILIKKNGEKLEFMQLSSGEKYVFAVVLELIYRNVVLNPQITNLKNTPGIVLIDEVESHLHPRWQLTILKAFQKSFPKVQFIVATHSPLIASSVRKKQVIRLSNFEIIPSDANPDIYSGTADELLKEMLFSDIQINDYEEKRREIDKYIKQLKFDLAEQKLNELKEQINSNPKWIIDYERKINFGKL